VKKRWGLLLGTLLVPAALELNLRASGDCPARDYGSPCTQYSVMHPNSRPARSARISQLQQERAQGKHLSADEYQEHAEALLVLIDDPEFPANGIACRHTCVMLIRADLSPAAMRYVRQHELEHFITPEASETQVNYAAAKVQPVGMVVTAVSSVWRAFGRSSSLRCTLAGLWNTFHVYFLDAS